jgi:hypothetical protein
MSSSAWLRRGSSIVFDKHSLGPLITKGFLISLREALSWMKAWPAQPPEDGQTVLVGGLETCLEVLSPEDAEEFLRNRITPFVLEFQSRWDQQGLVFGFGTTDKSFEVTASQEEVLFLRRDRKRVRLSYSLWDGSATMNVTRLVRDDRQTGKRITLGYYVPRIS